MPATRFGFIIALLFLGLLTRLVPHWPNFTAVGAVALMGAASLKPKWIAPFLTLGILIISDIFLGFYNSFGIVYAAFLVMAFQGLFMKADKAGSVILHSVTASVLFFLITNFAEWAGSAYYAQNVSGLMACYAAGLPFLFNFILGTVVYGLGIHAALLLANKRFFAHA